MRFGFICNYDAQRPDFPDINGSRISGYDSLPGVIWLLPGLLLPPILFMTFRFVRMRQVA